MLLAGTSAVLLAIQPRSAHVPALVVYLCSALAFLGLYGMLAPLLHLPPWHATANMNRLIHSQWRGIQWQRRARRLLRLPAKTPHRVGPGVNSPGASAPLLDRLVTVYGEGEQLRARIFWSGFAIPRDLMHGTARQAQIERERWARDWDTRVLDALTNDVRPTWIAATTLPEHTLDPASTIPGVREFLAKKLVCLREIIGQLTVAAHGSSPHWDELSDTDRVRIAREAEQRMARTIHDPLLRSLDNRNKAAAQQPLGAAPEWSAPPLPPDRPGAPLLRAMGQHPEQRKKRERAIRRGEELMRLIVQAELQNENAVSKTSGLAFHSLAATVEAWASGNGSTEEVPQFRGDPGADLARLKTFVQMEVGRLVVLQETKCAGALDERP
jgi:hypothetical protein